MGRRRFVKGILAASVLLAGAACTDLDQASASGVAPADAVAEIAGQLADSADLTYTATYRLPGGATATVTRAQDPVRTAYRWPTGRLILTPATTIQCSRPTTCTVTGGPAASPIATRSADATGERAAAELPAGSGLITAEAVEAMLRTAETDPALEITQRDTTFAERHAACIRLRGAFEVCVTGDGTLAAFTGTLAGTKLDLTLTDLTSTADESAFQPPPGAELTGPR